MLRGLGNAARSWPGPAFSIPTPSQQGWAGGTGRDGGNRAVPVLPRGGSRSQQGKFKMDINKIIIKKKYSGSNINITLEETALSHLEVLKERLD